MEVCLSTLYTKKEQASLRSTIVAALKTLPKSADAIAGELGRQGLRAKCGEAMNCALAQVLANRTGLTVAVTGVDVDVWPAKVTKAQVQKDTFEPAVTVSLTEAQRQFVARFDDRDYPWLISQKKKRKAA